MKKTIRLSENKLRSIIKESVKRILRESTLKLNEYGDTPTGQYMLGRLQARKENETWAPSWKASEERDNAAAEAEKQGKSYNITHNNMLKAYRDGRNGVKWNESLNRLIKENIKRALREAYEDKISHINDAFDFYANKVSSGQELSDEQLAQIQEMYDFLNDTNAHDNVLVTDYLIPMAQNFLNGRNPDEGLSEV